MNEAIYWELPLPIRLALYKARRWLIRSRISFTRIKSTKEFKYQKQLRKEEV